MASSKKEPNSRMKINIEQNVYAKNVMVGSDNTLIDTHSSTTGNEEDFPNLPSKKENNGVPKQKVVDHGMQCNITGLHVGSTSERSTGAIPKRTFAQVTQNIQANEVVNVINVAESPSHALTSVPNIESETTRFLDAVKSFRYGHLILVADHMEPSVNIQTIGLVPWTFIFDFDPKSRSDGLLSQVETVIKSRRSLHINTWQEKCSITDQSTHWMFLKGAQEQPDSKCEAEFAKWKKQTRSGLEHILEQLKKFGESYTEYYVVNFWPHSENMSLHVKHLIEELEGIDLCKFIIIIDNQGNNLDSVLKSLQRELPAENQPKIIRLDIAAICVAINTLFVQHVSAKISRFALPTNDPAQLDINSHQAQWLKEDLEVLYKTSPYDYENSLENLQKQSDDFYRGGNWPWHMWYEMNAGHVDVERDIMKDVIESLRKYHIDVYKSGRVTICHAPGSGGSTLAQRILWELRNVTPCAQVKLRTGTSDVASRVEFLYEKTRKPIVLLLDGEDEQRVELLMQDLRDLCYVILYIKRYTYPMTDKRNSHNRFWLKTYVSRQEAMKIAYKYLQQCDNESKKKAVKKLQRAVENENSDHAIFEFGLATYTYEYKGIESYVKGFLQFDDDADSSLLPWQHALAILSLVYYYGQMPMPCKFFSKMVKSDTLLQINDFPPEMQGLIVTDINDARTNMVRISHYLVAKEVLEQVLTRPKPRGERCPELCKAAKRKLEPFAIDFIKRAGVSASKHHSKIIVRIMTRTFISRDNKAAGETDLVYPREKRKGKFAPILHDVGCKQPFTERFHVFKELTKAFPREAQFQAHLGRLYSLCRPEAEERAESCFGKALEICKEEMQILGISAEQNLPHTMRLTLMYIYHMYGNMFLTRVSKYTGKYHGDKPERNVLDGKFELTIQELYKMVSMACNYFTKCRDITPEGLEDDHGFIGEITIRLMFCDFVHRKYSKGDIYAFMNLYENREITDFVEECISAIDGLILECLSVVDPDKIEHELLNCQTWFTSLFKMKTPGKIISRAHDNVKSRRIQIAARKLLYEKKKVFGVLEEVTKTSDIQFIVKEYEKNFVDIHDNCVESPRQAIDLDYREWIFAIRHNLLCKEYALEDVLTQVRLWHEKIRTPSSRFYLFILCSLLGFGSTDIPGNTQLLIEAIQLKEEMLKQAKYVPRPRYPREWLGLGTGIRRLTPGTRFFGAIEGREIKGNFDNDALEKRVGTITGPNDKPASGYISLDLGEDSVVSVKVFYVPVRADMNGTSYAGARVQFYLGFSIAHGYEAYNVLPVKTACCKNCGLYVELHVNDQALCKCGEIVNLNFSRVTALERKTNLVSSRYLVK